MTNKSEHQLTEAMVDETLDESFPASDPPGWTLGLDPLETSGLSEDDQRQRYKLRRALLELLSSAELAQVARSEGEDRLALNEEYLDLSRLELGVLIASVDQPAEITRILPRTAVSAETWAKIRQLTGEKNSSR